MSLCINVELKVSSFSISSDTRKRRGNGAARDPLNHSMEVPSVTRLRRNPTVLGGTVEFVHPFSHQGDHEIR